MSEIAHQRFWWDNGAGWALALHRFHAPGRLTADRPPVLIIPGFAMNSFIFRHHPTGASLVEYLARLGLEVWTADLRFQGDSRQRDAATRFGLWDMAMIDVTAAIEGVRHHSEVNAERVDAIGCSLGAAYLFMQVAWNPTHRIRRLVNMGGPMRWTDPPCLIRALARVPLVWRIPLRGTRRLARAIMPWMAKIPGLLHVYLHPSICDLSDPDTLVQAIEDTHPGVNREIAHWITTRNLELRGRNLTRDLATVTCPLLTVIAHADGIVPEATTRSGHDAMIHAPRTLLRAGDAAHPMAHADLFISELAEAEVFEPLGAWLLT